jgi:hypothetical protein
MLRGVLTWLLLFSPVVLAAAAPGDCGPRLAALSDAFDSALLRTKAEYGDLVKSIHVDDVAPVPGYPSRIEVSLVPSSGKRSVVGWMNYEVQDGRLVMDVHVAKNDRGVGLNRLMLLAVLKKHPEIKEVSGYLTETNAAAYLVHLALSPSKNDRKSLTEKAFSDASYREEVFKLLMHEIAQLTTGERAKMFRQRMIDAYASGSPAGRTEQAAGFKTVKSIVLSPLSAEDFGVGISATTDPAHQKSETDVSIELGQGNWIEISPEGVVKKTFIPPKR